jgi:hypothetical protein
MDAIAWLTALYIALWVSVYVPSPKSEPPQETKQVQEVKK